MSSPATPLSRTVPSEEEYPSVHLLLLVTGSVAAVKTGLLLDQLSTERCNIRIAATKAAFHFLRRAQPSKTGIPFHSIITDEQEWNEWQAMNDSVVHIELRRWADLVVIVPLNANTLAKVANGLCDNLVSCVMRAWEVREKPVIICPAMNTAMWMHPITGRQLDNMAEWYCDPDVRGTVSWSTIIKRVMPTGCCCGDLTGNGGSSGSLATLHSATDFKANEEQSPLSFQQQQQEAPSGQNDATPEAATTSPATAPDATLPCPAALPSTLRECMYQVVGPVCKRLACGDLGIGGMASVEEIARHIRHTMELIREKKRQQSRAERARRAAEGEAAGAAAPTSVDTAPVAVKEASTPQPPTEAPPAPEAALPATPPVPAQPEPAPQHAAEHQSAPMLFKTPAMAKAYKGNMPVKKPRAR